MMAIASGRSMDEPPPRARASGARARIAASVVMAMGRSRLTPAWTSAWSGSIPSSSSASYSVK